MVLNTGGTIGMKVSDTGLVPAKDFLEAYCRNNIINQFNDIDVIWHEFNPLIDSSQISIDDWNNITRLIADNYQDIDAFLIVHGTDTLAFTSSMLGMLLKDISKPIVITGSMRAIQEDMSDGTDNLKLAIETCITTKFSGVLVCFNGQVMPGEHVTKVDASHFDAFSSPVNDHIRPLEPGTFQRLEVRAQPIDVFTFYPGCNFHSLESMVSSNSKAIILRSFGSGNAPESEQLNQLIKNAITQGKIVINMSQCVASQVDMYRYSAGSSLLNLGVLSAYNMTFEAVITKLQVLLSNYRNIDDVKSQLSIEWSRELPDRSY